MTWITLVLLGLAWNIWLILRWPEGTWPFDDDE